MKADKTHYQDLRERAAERFRQIERLQEQGLICKQGDFVPSVHYPPITRYPDVTEDFILKDYTMPEDGMMDIYVHFPFCAQRCLFCHYPGKVGPQEEEKEKYVTYLEREMDLYLEKLGEQKLKPRSILIGGGTPTYLSPKLLERFLGYFARRVDFSRCRQFNYDLDPMSLIGDEGKEKMEIMKAYGVDRLTIGFQSLDDQVLHIMNRGHGAAQAVESLYAASEMGFDTNIEFIYGHPGQTFENWVDVVEEAVKLPADEIQLYRLKVQAYGDMQGAVIQNRTKAGKTPIPDFQETMMMKQAALDILTENGYHENLRRVFSRQSRIYSHYAYNQCCNLYDQIGFGITAFSSFRDRFALNTQHFKEYYEKLDRGLLPVNRGYVRDREQQARWALILPLKNRDVRKKDYKKITGLELDQVFTEKQKYLTEAGLLEDTEKKLSLTELGKFVADEVAEQFNSVEFLPFPEKDYADGVLNPYRNNRREDVLGGEAVETD